MLRLFDSVHGEVRDLELRDPARVSIYVCGPTVYGLPHLGHGRYTLIWDVARRWFTFRGYEVNFVSNITDVDDKIIARAQEEGRSEAEIAALCEQQWWDAMDALGVLRPDETPHATNYIDAMVALIDDFVARDIGYTNE